MNIIELNKNEVSNISGGFSTVDYFNLYGGPLLAGYLTAIIFTPELRKGDYGNGGLPMKALKIVWATFTLPILAKTAITALSLYVFGYLGGIIDEKIRGSTTPANNNTPNQEGG